jgi:hypothetical protein
MKKLILISMLAAMVFPTAAAASPQFGFSTESSSVYRKVAKEMPVQFWAPFVAFRYANEFNVVLNQAKAFHKTPVITWETWDPHVPYQIRSHHPAPGLADAQVANGSQDRYIKRQAKYVKAYRGTVYIRLDHEFNGYWYPWSYAKPGTYVRMWRHVWTLFHRAGVRNVRWIWSPNLNTYQPDAAFDAKVRAYYPGSKYVDIVGSTVSRVLAQGSFYSSPAWFFQRQDRLLVFRKPIWISEALVDLQEIKSWMPAFRQAIDSRPWIKGVIWLSTVGSQQASFGNMNWMLSDQPFARHYLTWKKGFRP